MTLRRLTVALAITAVASCAWALDANIVLWPNGAPGATGTAEDDKPSINVYLPAASNNAGIGVVLCPGGGYTHMSPGEELVGSQWLTGLGITAFVLHYRVSPYRHPYPMLDGQRAVRLVRARAAQWGIDPNRIGLMGFSAGGHVASTVGTHYDGGDPSAVDTVDKFSCRPDFMLLVYAVITMGPSTESGSALMLLGPSPPDSLRAFLSNENHVTAQTPPTFLNHGSSDGVVSPANSIMFRDSLKAHGVTCSLYVDPGMPHGYGVSGTWAPVCERWMRANGFLPQARISLRQVVVDGQRRPSSGRWMPQVVTHAGASWTAGGDLRSLRDSNVPVVDIIGRFVDSGCGR